MDETSRTQKDSQGKMGNNLLPFNHEALLKEYELKFNYVAGLSPRILTLVSAHIIFLGASLVTFFGEKINTAHRYSIAGINFVLCCLCLWWLCVLGRRYRSNRRRINEIANSLGIRGYHQNVQCEHSIPKIPFSFTMSWFGIVAFFWIVVCFIIR